MFNRKDKKRLAVLEELVERLGNEIVELEKIYNKMWDEVHPQTMGGN